MNTDDGELMGEAGCAVLVSTWRREPGSVSELTVSMLGLLDEVSLRRLVRVSASVGTAASAELLIRAAAAAGEDLHLDYRSDSDQVGPVSGGLDSVDDPR